MVVASDEFAALMATLGGWNAERGVAVAVSGGADSMCLALLAARWGRPLALIVDHGLRACSAGEAGQTAQRLAGIGVPAKILTLRGLRRGAGLAARARTARYAALTQAAREAGLVDLLLGHHLRDQAETVLLRRLSRSGPAGLAAMPAVSETPWLRLLRPLLSIPPARLRATLTAAGLGWVEDPSNRDTAALRARLRLQLNDPDGDGAQTVSLAAAAADFAGSRAEADAQIAAVLAERAMLRPEGFAVLSAGPIPAAALSALIRTVSGAAYPPASSAVAALAADPGPAVLHGVRLLPAGRLGPGILLVREAAAMAPPAAAYPGVVWDRRFRLGNTALPPFIHDAAPPFICDAAPPFIRDAAPPYISDAAPPPGTTIGALGHETAALRHLTDLPAAVLQTLPALRIDGVLAAVPHIGYHAVKFSARMVFSPASPAAGAPFLSPGGGVPTAPTRPMLGDAA